jgi:hypothetical protein
MKVHLLSVFPGVPGLPTPSQWLRESAARDPFGQHHIVESPRDADIILFVESHESNDPYMLTVARHPIWRRYEEKCLVYHDADWAVPVLRGVYPSIGKSDFQPERCRSGGYIARIDSNQYLSHDPSPVPRDYLYSFAGAANASVRHAIFSRAHPRGLVRDTTGKSLWALKGEMLHDYERDYVDTIRRSHFVLCPRGYGPATYRLFETMEMGRVPVVMSDEWVPPEGPPWDECVIRLSERSIPDIEPILNTHVDRAEHMGRRAREIWLQWFSKPVAFHRLIEWCADLLRTQPDFLSAVRAWNVLLNSPHRRIWLGGEYRRMRASVRRLCSSA